MLRCVGALLLIFLLLSLIVHLSIMAEMFGIAAIAFLLADVAQARGLKRTRHWKLREPYV